MLKKGDRFGDYTVVRLLGQGGMGSVFLLENADGGLIAAKILDPETAGDPESRKRFLREAELALGVKHPNLVETYDVGEDPDTGLCYILMEYVPGGSLSDRIDKGPLAINEALSIVYQIADVLELARQKGIVHRDIKPDNIMFGADGKAKLADLGIARQGGETMTTTVTQAGIMIGTPAYMSPEQMMDSHNVDTRADIYSLGIVFYEMLTGTRPNKDDTVVQLLSKAMQGVPIPDVRGMRPEVPAAVADLVSFMCAMDVDERVQTPVEVTTAISQIVHGRKVTIRRKSSRAVARPKPRREFVRVILPLLILSGLAAAGVWSYHRYRSQPTPTAPAAQSAVRDLKDSSTAVPDSSAQSVEPAAAKPTPSKAEAPAVPREAARPAVRPTAVAVTSAPVRASSAMPAKRVSNRERPIVLDLGEGEKLEFVACPAGAFEMGWPNEPASSPYAAHRVEITRPFWMSRYQLTRRQWRVLTGKRLTWYPPHDDLLGGEQRPALGLPREAVVGFCRQLTDRFAAELPKGYAVRFPTYAEWEYALRSGDEDPEDDHAKFRRLRSISSRAKIAWELDDAHRVLLAAGRDTFPSHEALVSATRKKWYDHQPLSDQENRWLRDLHHPAAVGQKAPNAWGLHDMYGNGHETLLDTVPSSLRGDCIRSGFSWAGKTCDPLFVCVDKKKWQMNALSMIGKVAVIGRQTCSIRLVIGPTDFNGGETTLKEVEDALCEPAENEKVRRPVQPAAEPTKPQAIKRIPALPGKTFGLNRKVELNLVGCPAGTFQMGYAEAPPEAKAATVHEVRITRPFWIGKHPVTRAQWSVLMGDVKLTAVDKALGGLEAPMTAVTAAAMRDCCQKLTRKFRSKLPKGYVFRLPTDAEWEYASRGGTDDPDDPHVRWQPLERKALFAVLPADKKARLAKAGIGENQLPNGFGWFIGPCEVCTKKPNGWGLYDMLGNVDERVLDTFPVENPDGSFKRSPNFVKGEITYPPSETDPLRRHDGSDAIGMMRSNADGSHVGRRRFYSLEAHDLPVGFRVVLGPDLEKERQAAARKKAKKK